MSLKNDLIMTKKIKETCENNKLEYLKEKMNNVSPKSMSMREIEMVRLIGQYLCEKGYENAYDHLSRDSGIALEPQAATDLRSAILSGNWDECEKAVDELSSIINNSGNLAQIRFLLLEQKFLELLESNDVMAAVTLLRNRITPLQRNTERVHMLASCLMCRTGEEVRLQAGGWSGTHGGSRLKLVDCIQKFVPAQTMLHPGRLKTLITEAVRAQLNACTFHNQLIEWPGVVDTVSLLQPHTCSIHDFPAFLLQTIDHRDTDLWFCKFSPNGKYLATGGKDANVDIWKVNFDTHTILFCRTLETTESYIGYICWSPDSKKLAVCQGEVRSSVVVFNVHSKEQLCTQKVNEEDVYSAAAFFSDSRKLAFGGIKGPFYVIDTEDDGRVLVTVEGYRVQCMVAIIHQHPIVESRNALSDMDDLMNSRFSSDPSTPGAPIRNGNDSAARSNSVFPVSSVQLTSDSVRCMDNSGNPCIICDTDQLLIADSLHRVRLFKFGYTNSTLNNHPPQDMDDLVLLPETTSTQASHSWVASTQQPGTTPSNRGSLTAISIPLTAMPTAGMFTASSTPGAPPVTSRTTIASASTGSLLTIRQGQNPDSGTGRVNLHASSSPGSAITLTGDARHAHIHPRSLIYSHGGYPEVSGDSSSVGSESIFHITAPADIASSSTGIVGLSGPAVVTSSLSASAMVASLLHSYSLTVGSRFPFTPISAVATPITSSTGVFDASIQASVTSTTAGTTSAQPALGSSLSLASATNGNPINQSYGLVQHSTLFKEIHAIQSLSLSVSGKRLLVTLHKMGLHLRDLESHAIIQRFWGFKQDTYKLSSSIGGINEDFVASGSEDGYLHLWHVNSDNRPIHSVMAATGHYPVTCVSWNPSLSTMIASVNDEGEIRIWAPSKYIGHCG